MKYLNKQKLTRPIRLNFNSRSLQNCINFFSLYKNTKIKLRNHEKYIQQNILFTLTVIAMSSSCKIRAE